MLSVEGVDEELWGVVGNIGFRVEGSEFRVTGL